MHLDLAENNIKSVARPAATFIRYRCPLGHNFAHSAQFPSKLGIQSANMLDYIDKQYSMRKSSMCGAMKTVSLLFDHSTYVWMDGWMFLHASMYVYVLNIPVDMTFM